MTKKQVFALLLALCLLLSACAGRREPKGVDVLATTAPISEIVSSLLGGTGLQSGLLISDGVSCLHDYSLSVAQMESVETAKLVVINGGGLEDFMSDVLSGCPAVIDASAGLALLPAEHDDHDTHDGHEEHGEFDPHVWLAPENMIAMTRNVAAALTETYPEHTAKISENADALCQTLSELQAYGEQQLSTLSCRELVTFHDGFAYFAHAFGLEIAASMEIESGSEPSARELERIIRLVQTDAIPAVFTETNGDTGAAELVSRETGCTVDSLDTAIGTMDYFSAMYANIDTIKEALG